MTAGFGFGFGRFMGRNLRGGAGGSGIPAQVAALLSQAFVINDQTVSVSRTLAGLDQSTNTTVAGNVRRRTAVKASYNADAVESAGTQLLLRSDAIGTSPWAASAATFTQGVADPFGTATASALAPTATNAAHYAQQSVALAASTTYTWSLRVKANGIRRVALGFATRTPAYPSVQFDLIDGEVVGQYTAAIASAFIVKDSANPGWFTLGWSQAAGTGASGTSVQIYLCDDAGNLTFAGDPSQSILVARANLVAGTVAGTSVPSTTTAVARAADSIHAQLSFVGPKTLPAAAGTTLFVARPYGRSSDSQTPHRIATASARPGFVAPAPAANAVLIHVDPAGNDSTGTGAVGAPYATLARAQTAVRAASPGTAEIVVYLRAGTHRLTSTLALTNADGGTAAAPVSWRPYPGETPVISGGRVLNGWSAPSGGIVTIDSTGGAFRQMYVNGVRATIVRSALRTVAGWDESAQRLLVTSADAADIAVGCEIILQQHWREHVLIVASKTVSGANYALGFSTGQQTQIYGNVTFYRYAGQAYRVQNSSLQTLATGQFYRDPSTLLLSYKTRAGEIMANGDAVVPAVTRLVSITGTALGTRVPFLHLYNLSFAESNWTAPNAGMFCNIFDEVLTTAGGVDYQDAAVRLSSAVGCNVQGCSFARIGGVALVFADDCRTCSGSDTIADDLSGGGIVVNQARRYTAGDIFINQGITVDRCTVTNYGVDYAGSPGINLVASQDVSCRQCEVAFGKYSGIVSFSALSYAVTGIGATAVEDNYVHHVMRELADGAAIYTTGRQPQTSIRNNLLTDIARSATASTFPIACLYFDEGSSLITASGNRGARLSAVSGAVPTLIYRQGGSNAAKDLIESDNLAIADASPLPTLTAGTLVVDATGGTFNLDGVNISNPRGERAGAWNSFALAWDSTGTRVYENGLAIDRSLYSPANPITGLRLGDEAIGTKTYAGEVIGIGWAKKLTDSELRAVSDYLLGRPTAACSITCYGDSITQGVLGATSYTTLLRDRYLPNADVFNGGIGGETSAQIRARALADTVHKGWFHIIEIGRNNSPWNPTALIADINAIIAHITEPARFLVLAVLNGAGEGITSAPGTYAAIKAMNDAMAGEYGSRFADIRAALIASGGDGSAADLADIADDVPPLSLRGDFLHPNTAGNRIIAALIADAARANLVGSESPLVPGNNRKAPGGNRRSLPGGNLRGLPSVTAINWGVSVTGNRWYVDTTLGNDSNAGTVSAPFKTIQAGSDAAYPGDAVLIMAGVYRERVAPPRGGTSANGIIYVAQPGKRVVIKGCDIFSPTWTAHGSAANTWYADVAQSIFNDDFYSDDKNPFKCILSASPYGIDGFAESDATFNFSGGVQYTTYTGNSAVKFSTGFVWINGVLLTQRPFLLIADVPANISNTAVTPGWEAPHSQAGMSCEGTPNSFYYDTATDRLYINTGGAAPAANTVELSTRKTCFAPHLRGLGYITCRGLIAYGPASNFPKNFWTNQAWAQNGAFSTRSGNHWTFDACAALFAHVGCDMGVQADTNDVERLNAARPGYVGDNTFKNGWIDSCCVGIMDYGCYNNKATSNTIERINPLRFKGNKRAEQSGIKFFGRDETVENNFIRDVNGRGIWVDGGFYRSIRVRRNIIIRADEFGIQNEMSNKPYGDCYNDNNLLISCRLNGVHSNDGSGWTSAHNTILGTIAGGTYGTYGQTFYRGAAICWRFDGNRGVGVNSKNNESYGNIFAGNAIHYDIAYPKAGSSATGRRLQRNVYADAGSARLLTFSSLYQVPQPANTAAGELDDLIDAAFVAVSYSSPPVRATYDVSGRARFLLPEWKGVLGAIGETNRDQNSITWTGVSWAWNDATLTLSINTGSDNPTAVGSQSLPLITYDLLGNAVPSDGSARPGCIQSIATGANSIPVWTGPTPFAGGSLPYSP